MAGKNTHCSYCGCEFEPGPGWPRVCAGCGNTTFLNPAPVSVVLLPVEGGLLAVRRAIPPHIGMLALPGGYINVGESWQQAGARELLEETGVQIEPDELRAYDVRSAPDSTLLIFGLAQPRRLADLPPFYSSDAESSERTVIYDAAGLAFSLHAAVAGAFLQQG